MSTLTPLDSRHNFSSGDISTDGYLAVIPAFQSIFFADGRDYDDKGFHKLVFHTTKIAGETDAAFTAGEVVTQANTDAKGIYIECIDIMATAVMTGQFQVGEKVTQATSLAIGYVVYVGDGFINIATVSFDSDTGVRIDFEADKVITGATSGAVTASTVAVTAIGVGMYHYIYRTTPTEFDATDIVGATSGSTLDPAAVSAVQTLTPDAQATSGTFTLTYDGQTTTAIAYNASAATIKTALEVLSTVDEDDIVVSGKIFSDADYADGLIFTFADTLGSVPAVTITESMGGTNAVTVAKTVTGTKAVTAPPHWMNWVPTSPGTFPDGGSNIGCLCFGRIFLNSMFNPHQWSCSEVFNSLGWDTSQTDAGASTNSQNAKAGEVGNPIIAMIPYKDNYLIWGCANEMWLLRGDPLQGGINTCLSKTTGIFSPTSWCWDDKNNLYFIGTDGIYSFSAEALISGAPPTNITKQNIPKLVTQMGLNRKTDRIAMAYDKQRYGIEISVTQMDGLWSVCFWLDLRTGGLFPDRFPTSQSPASMYYYDSYKSSERSLLLGGYDGYIRKFDEAELNDQGGNAITSWCTIGPFVNDSNTRDKVVLNEIALTLGEDTDSITVETYSADSADEVITNVLDGDTPAATKTLKGDGLKSSVRDRITSPAIAIKISNDELSESWNMETINTNIKSVGKKK